MENPWTFHGFFAQKSSIWIMWMMMQGVIHATMRCQHMVNHKLQLICGNECSLQSRSAKIDGMTWRCKKDSNHETTIRYGSFFNGFKHTIPDILEFIKCYLDSLTMKKCASFSNVHYKSTAVYWCSYIRDLFVQYVYEYVIKDEMKLSGIVEIDESHFGKKCKYHCGNVKSQIDVWIVGLVQRGSSKKSCTQWTVEIVQPS